MAVTCLCRLFLFAIALHLVPITLVCSYVSFSHRQIRGKRRTTHGLQSGGFVDDKEEGEQNVACLEGHIPSDQCEELKHILLDAGYKKVLLGGFEAELHQFTSLFRYRYMKASGMLKLIEGTNVGGGREAPKYIPVQRGMENVLVANGWSFLDPDESEPISAFDVDAANREGQYIPKWGLQSPESPSVKLSFLGYNLHYGGSYENDTFEASSSVTPQAKKVLLDGGTDPPHIKMTNNKYDFSTRTQQSKPLTPEGIFVCAIGSLPLFSTADLQASSGWLSFRQPLANDHLRLIHPNKFDLDQRIEVVDAKTGCHLGHFFGDDGFCINASALNFIPVDKKHKMIPLVLSRGGPFMVMPLWKMMVQIQCQLHLMKC